MVPVALLVIDLSDQRLTAYDATGRAIYAALVSTGVPPSPTPVGRFRIATKYAETPLVGSGYRIPAVPHVMCLEGEGLAPDLYCLHPAPWQERDGLCFGVARSHGCIRTTTTTARWLFQRTPVGTPVTIQP